MERAMPEYAVTFSMGMIFTTIAAAGVLLKRKGADFRGADPVLSPVYIIGKVCPFAVRVRDCWPCPFGRPGPAASQGPCFSRRPG